MGRSASHPSTQKVNFTSPAAPLLGAIWSAVTDHSPLMWLFAMLLELQFGLLFLFFGLLGVQIRAISDRTRGTPLVIERERVNFGDEG